MDQILPNPLLLSTRGRFAISHHMTATEKVKFYILLTEHLVLILGKLPT
jgi:hypothetical protein